MRKCENRARERALAYNFPFCLPAVDQKCARAQVFECDFLTVAIQTEIYFVELLPKCSVCGNKFCFGRARGCQEERHFRRCSFCQFLVKLLLLYDGESMCCTNLSR